MNKIPEPARTELINSLSHAHGRARLVIDGQDVAFEVRLEKPLHYLILPFVDGSFQGKWLMRPDESLDDVGRFAQRLLRPRIMKLYGPKRLKEFNLIRKRAGLALITKEQNEWSQPTFWRCPKALVRHLEKEFDSIEIVEPERAAA